MISATVEKGKTMIKLEVDPYCENCECFEPEAIMDRVSLKEVCTTVICKNCMHCANAVEWVRKHENVNQI